MNVNRIIDFRAKRLDNGKWVHGDLHLRCEKPHIHMTVPGSTHDMRYDIDRDTIGQFISLMDCNDCPLYEGDLVQYCGVFFECGKNDEIIATCVGTIVFKWGGFRIKRLAYFYDTKRRFKHQIQPDDDTCLDIIHPSMLTVIGNIYDDGDKLKDQMEREGSLKV